MTPVKQSSVAIVITLCIAGLVVLALGMPKFPKLKISFGGLDPASEEYIRDLAVNRVAAALDPTGHDQLHDLLADPNDAILVADGHETKVEQGAIAVILVLVLLLLGNLGAFVLWKRDQRGSLWLVASAFVLFAPLPAIYLLLTAPFTGAVLLAITLWSIVIVAREGTHALRLRNG